MATAGELRLTLADRVEAGLAAVREIVGKVWPYIIAGIAIGAAIHGYVPEDFMASFMGRDAPWWSLPAAVLLGVPMYTNAAGVIPIVEALIGLAAIGVATIERIESARRGRRAIAASIVAMGVPSR